jgi:hypothetical protein
MGRRREPSAARARLPGSAWRPARAGAGVQASRARDGSRVLGEPVCRADSLGPRGSPPPVGANIEGELIAAAGDSIYVLTRASVLESVPVANIARGTLTSYDASTGRLRPGRLIGTLTTLSPGFVLVLSAPAWIATGTAPAVSASRGPRVESKDAAVLSPYARFPQGLPAGLDVAGLRAKDVRETMARRARENPKGR